MTNRKANKIRLKITAGLKDLKSFYTTIESYAHFKSFAITYNKTKQRMDTPLYDGWYELTEIEDRKS
tara:strand:+ start:9142 stop:9342 length:201 start_codon:yes stop_codon:yes gene_type:complete